MLHRKSKDVESQAVTKEGARETFKRLLVGEKDGPPNFQMRLFEVRPGGHSPYHSHAWEHETYIVSGRGSVRTEQGNVAIEAGDVVFLKPGETHSFQADGGETLSFICCVPNGAS